MQGQADGHVYISAPSAGKSINEYPVLLLEFLFF